MSGPTSGAASIQIPSHVSKSSTSKLRSLTPSNISLFVSNLRLLNLDQRPDWPDITIKTFDTKDALQNQKKRVSCVEWALYRLFEIWDRETTRDKLQPFFPPLEPIQSLNLRAALFRCLNELKKNDVLGREATLRKTMLDDCKGDKFEEILVLFSAVVVRKQVLATRRKQPFNISKNLAVVKNLSKDDLSNFTPLSLAYRASLTKNLHERSDLKSTLRDFQTTLQQRRDEYQQRHSAVRDIQAANKEDLPSDAEAVIRRELHQNWVGSIEGCEALLGGTKAASSDAYIDSNFDDLWKHSRQGTTPSVPPENVTLLETLQDRVFELNERLRMWKTYREVVDKPSDTYASQSAQTASKKDSSAAAYGLDIFNKHKVIRPEQDGPSTVQSTAQYDDILCNMDQALVEVSKKKRNQQQRSNHRTTKTPPGASRRTNVMPKPMPVPVFLASHKLKDDLFSPLKRPLPMSANSTPTTTRRKYHSDSPSPPSVDSTPVPLRPGLHQIPSQLSRCQTQPLDTSPQSSNKRLSITPHNPRYTQSTRADEMDVSPASYEDEHPETHLPHVEDQQQQPTYSSPAPTNTSSIEAPTPTLESALRDLNISKPRQRTSSPSTSTPTLDSQLYDLEISKPRQLTQSPTASPPPHSFTQESPENQASLSERARLSMTSRHNSAYLPDTPSSPPLPVPSSPTSPTSPLQPMHTNTTLADRARRSISQSFSSSSASQNHSTTRSSRPRSSFLPSANTTTPAKAKRMSLGGGGGGSMNFELDIDTTPRDKLFDVDAEYDSVFKSRPKIAQSPVLSPVRGGGFDGVDEEMEDVEGAQWSSSPLGGYGR